MKRTTKNLEETYALAAELLPEFEKLAAGGSVLVGLRGDLGSGKTSFVQGIARALGVAEHVTSPTFVLEKLYEISSPKTFSRLVHIDAYRLEGNHDLDGLGVADLLKAPSNLVLVEWPEHVQLSKILTIYFTFIDENTREIEF